jgi:hypothetical protein
LGDSQIGRLIDYGTSYPINERLEGQIIKFRQFFSERPLMRIPYLAIYQSTQFIYVIGVAIAAGLARAAESLLFQMTARDPFVFAAATVILVAVAICAGLIPAHRASRVACESDDGSQIRVNSEDQPHPAASLQSTDL